MGKAKTIELLKVEGGYQVNLYVNGTLVWGDVSGEQKPHYKTFEEAYKDFVERIEKFAIPLQNIYHNINYLFYRVRHGDEY